MRTFGQLKAGDEVYVIRGCKVEIVKVASVFHFAERNCTHIVTCYSEDYTAMDAISCWGLGSSIICSDIDDAMRRMQDVCATSLHDYKCASGALNLLELKKKEY